MTNTSLVLLWYNSASPDLGKYLWNPSTGTVTLRDSLQEGFKKDFRDDVILSGLAKTKKEAMVLIKDDLYSSGWQDKLV